jgi:hypothetical protein
LYLKTKTMNKTQQIFNFLTGLGFELDAFYALRIYTNFTNVSMQGDFNEKLYNQFEQCGFEFNSYTNGETFYNVGSKLYKTGFGDITIEIVFTRKAATN